MIKIKAGDKIKVLRGKDKGKEGKVERVLNSVNKVLIPGINMYKKHVKAATARDGKGGIYEIPRPLPLSNVLLICPNCKKSTRVGFRLDSEKKVRICKKCNVSIDSKTKKSK